MKLFDTVLLGQAIETGKAAVRSKANEHRRDTARAAQLRRESGIAATPESARNITAADARYLREFLHGGKAAAVGHPEESES